MPFLIGSSTSDLEVALYRLSAISTLVEELEGAEQRAFQDWLNEPGAGSFALRNTDADLGTISFPPDGQDLALFRYRGQAALMIIIESWEKVTRSRDEEVAQLTTLAGRGHLAVLERSVVYPTGGVGRIPVEDDRYFDWKAPTPSFDHSAWANVAVICTVAAAQITWGGSTNTWDADFPDPAAAVLGPSTGSTTMAPVCDDYIREDFSVPDTATYMLYGLADNIAYVYVDGQFIVQIGLAAELSAFTEMWSAPLKLSAGSHTIAIRLVNSALPPAFAGGNNPTGVAWTLFQPDGLGGLGNFVAHSSSAARIVECPLEPPGMTVGKVMILCLQEAQARGELVGVTWTFTEFVDSDGVAWPISTDIATKVETDYLTFFRELSTYCEIWMRPGSLELSAWNIGGRGAPQTATLTLNSNITSLIHRGESSPITALLSRLHDEWVDREDAAAVAAYGRNVSALRLGAQDNRTEAYRILDAQLDLFAHPREEIEAGHRPASDAERPYLAHKPGDTLPNVPRADGSLSTERLYTISMFQDDRTSNVEIIYTLRDVILDADVRFAQLVKKANDPSLMGRSRATQTASPVL